MRRRKWAASLTLRLLAAGLTVYLLLGVVFGISIVRGDSMEPTLQSGDAVLVYRLRHVWRNGDIVLIRRKDGYYIKRITAGPGQTVDTDEEEGVLQVDGKAVTEPETYGSTHRRAGCALPLTLGTGEYFVLGDHREISVDSRDFGPVEEAQLTGQVIAVLRLGS